MLGRQVGRNPGQGKADREKGEMTGRVKAEEGDAGRRRKIV